MQDIYSTNNSTPLAGVIWGYKLVRGVQYLQLLTPRCYLVQPCGRKSCGQIVLPFCLAQFPRPSTRPCPQAESMCRAVPQQPSRCGPLAAPMPRKTWSSTTGNDSEALPQFCHSEWARKCKAAIPLGVIDAKGPKSLAALAPIPIRPKAPIGGAAPHLRAPKG